MADFVEVKTKGVVEVEKELDRIATALTGPPMVKGVRSALMPFTRSARQFAPAFTSRLRGSIVPSVTSTMNAIKGAVGSNVVYAPFQEEGTGTFVGKAPHFPPPSALEVWARRKGLNAWAVAISIFRRGGLRPLWYMRRAFRQNKDKAVRILEDAVARIVK